MNFAGADGCAAGWLAVWIDDGGRHAWHVAQSFADVAKGVEDGLLLVDIPIGLRDAGPERACDAQARKLLRRRASSVFPAPCRGVLQSKTYAEASALNQRLCGRKLSRQSWALVPKIREVDDYLRREGWAGPVVREMHPELCFAGLSAAPMEHAKKTDAGFRERLKLLAPLDSGAEALVTEVLGSTAASAVAPDDVLDALVGAVTGFVFAERLRTLPETPEIDSRGLRMEMVFAPRP